MAVFRVEKTRNYTVMSNYHLRDKSVAEGKGPVVPDAVAAGGLGLHHQGTGAHL